MLEDGREIHTVFFPYLENLSRRDHHVHDDLNDALSFKLRPKASIIYYTTFMLLFKH